MALWDDLSGDIFEEDALLHEKDCKTYYFDVRRNFLECKICGVKYIGTEFFSVQRTNRFIETEISSPLKNIENIVEHGKRLASISREMRIQNLGYPPMKSLLMALSEAHSFVHFISWGITQLMIGVLKMAAQRVPVRGIVSGNVGEQIMCEVHDFKNEAFNLDIKFCESAGLRNIDIPHQKLIVIDGLLALKGSANLTQMSWRSAA